MDVTYLPSLVGRPKKGQTQPPSARRLKREADEGSESEAKASAAATPSHDFEHGSLPLLSEWPAFRQWSMGQAGEVREFWMEYRTMTMTVLSAKGRQTVWESGRWRAPFQCLLPTQSVDDMRTALFSELGKLGWELKAVSKQRFYFQLRTTTAHALAF